MRERNPGAAAHRPLTRAARPEAGWPAVVAAVLLAGIALLIWAGRGTLYTVDDLVWFMSSPGIDLDGLLQPHNGHLILIPRLIFHLDLELFGADYLPIRILTAALAAGAASCSSSGVRRRVGRGAALAGHRARNHPRNQLRVPDRRRRHHAPPLDRARLRGAARARAARPFGDAAACGLLCLGVVTYSVALPFVIAAAAAVGSTGTAGGPGSRRFPSSSTQPGGSGR